MATIRSQKITPFLWFDNQAEEAANFYTNVFSKRKEFAEDTKIISMPRYGDGGPGPKGSVMVAEFKLAGQKFIALNGGPQFKFTEAISFVIHCATQEEVDYFWDTLTADGGEESMCGWLKDKFGLSWQIVPDALPRLLSDKDAAKAGRVMAAMMKMQKIEIHTLQEAAENKLAVG